MEFSKIVSYMDRHHIRRKKSPAGHKPPPRFAKQTDHAPYASRDIR